MIEALDRLDLRIPPLDAVAEAALAAARAKLEADA